MGSHQQPHQVVTCGGKVHAEVHVPAGGRITLTFFDGDEALDLTSASALLIATGASSAGSDAPSSAVAEMQMPDGTRAWLGPVALTADQVLELLAEGVRVVLTAELDRRR